MASVLERLDVLLEKLQAEDDGLVLGGHLALSEDETIDDVRARVAKRSGRPLLTIVRGGRDDG